MSTVGRQTLRGLAEEAKKRVVLLLICVFGLSYLMSLTSTSVLINLPAAAAIVIFGLYLSHDLDVRRRAITSEKPLQTHDSSQKKSVELLNFPIDKSDWKNKVNSPPVVEATEQFTRHLVSEWVTDLWYSRITPDKDGPEELVHIMTGVIGEISFRAKDVNLIDLLTRDVINLVCNHLELYRDSQSKIGKKEVLKLSVDERDVQLKLVLAADNKLHPALFSEQAEHKVLQHLINGLISLVFKPEDLRCSFFRYTVRELLARAVIRPVVNLVNPRFINEKVEAFALSRANMSGKKVTQSAEEVNVVKQKGPVVPSIDQISGLLDQSSPGVELVQVKQEGLRSGTNSQTINNGMLYTMKGTNSGSRPGIYKANLPPKSGNPPPVKSVVLSTNSQDSHPIGTLASGPHNVNTSGGEWAQVLDSVSQRKAQALAPEHFDNMWTKGRNYKWEEKINEAAKPVAQSVFHGPTTTTTHGSSFASSTSKQIGMHINDTLKKEPTSKKSNVTDSGLNQSNLLSLRVVEPVDEDEIEPDSESSYPTEDDENHTVTGLDSPGTIVWESKNKTNSGISHIRHPLESSDIHISKKKSTSHVRHPRTSRTSSARKRSRTSNQKAPVWQEVERTSFLLGNGEDILNISGEDLKTEELNNGSALETQGRIYSGAAASSSFSSISTSESSYSCMKSPDIFVLADTFLKLRCEVVGANIVKSGSGSLAVYSISVTDGNNTSWSIKRRFRHFEELHRRLKEFSEYNLSLPPKHFLSSGLDVSVVQERCRLLDIYLKKLLQIPTISKSIEVWDFLSIDSQSYVFSDSLSIIQTLSVNLDDKPYEKSTQVYNSVEDVNGQLLSTDKRQGSEIREDAKALNKDHCESDGLRLRKGNTEQIAGVTAKREHNKNQYLEDSDSDSEYKFQKNVMANGIPGQLRTNTGAGLNNLQEKSQMPKAEVASSSIPTEWVPPNLSSPVLNLVDVIFQLQDGGWIRRQMFWVAKQLLQLGMGDAFDDWLLAKIQLLRNGVVIASGIKRIEQILWPDGIFITKHPKRKVTTPVSSPNSHSGNQRNGQLTTEQELEAARRAKFVYELFIDKAPAALVSLVGRKEYEQCVQDVYFFLQSPLCLRQLTFELLELLLLAVFPELDGIIRQCHEDKQQFGVVDNR